MKLVSWNVNGLRACVKKDFMASFAALDADIHSLPVVPEKRISSPALTATVLASDGVRPSSVGTTHLSVGFFSLAYRMTTDLPGMIAPPAGV